MIFDWVTPMPAVRKRLLLRNSRFEVAPEVGFALNRDFYHTILFGAKLEYHFNDWLSLGGSFGYGGVNVRTGLADNIIGQLPANYDSSTAQQLVPSQDQAKNAMLKLTMLIGVQANVTPFFGKMALFSRIFFNYDFYGFLGFGAAMYSDKSSGCQYNDASGTPQSCENPSIHDVNGSKGSPFKPGLTFGVGAHFFFNNWIALNAELRDTAVPGVNLSGRDINWDPQPAATPGTLLPPKLGGGDKQWDHIMTVFLGCSFYLPTTATMSR